MKELKTHLYYTWHIYLIVLVFLLSACYFAHDILIQPADTEEVRISFLGADVEAEELKTVLLKAMPGLSQQNITSVSASTVTITAYDIDSTLYVIANEADLIVAAESEITPEMASFYFYSGFDETQFGAEIYYADGIPCGVYLDGEIFSEFYTGEERCILFFGYKSPNLGGLNGRSATENDAALAAAKWLMG